MVLLLLLKNGSKIEQAAEFRSRHRAASGTRLGAAAPVRLTVLLVFSFSPKSGENSPLLGLVGSLRCRGLGIAALPEAVYRYGDRLLAAL